MYACYDYKDGSQGDAIWVYPEDLAVNTSVDELECWLRKRAEKEYPDKQELIRTCGIKLMIPIATWWPRLKEKTLMEFWDEFSQYFPEWTNAGEKVRKRLKEYEGKDRYWEIEPNDFVIGEEPIDNHYHYDFRISLLSGNCFPTKEAAETFMQNLTEVFKKVHQCVGTNADNVAPGWTLSAMETIHDWNWSYNGGLSVPLWPSYFIAPMNIANLVTEGEEESDQIMDYRKIWNIFGDEVTANIAYNVLQEMFRRNGIFFLGLMEFEDDLD